MLAIPSSTKLFVATKPVDFRKAFDGLSAIVRDVLQRDPFSGETFVFFNHRRDRIKLLVWESGFWLHYKRLESGCFESVPSSTGSPHLEISAAQLSMILEGFECKSAKKKKHPPLAIRPMPRTNWRAGRDEGTRETR